jgi:hypothetical protein
MVNESLRKFLEQHPGYMVKKQREYCQTNEAYRKRHNRRTWDNIRLGKIDKTYPCAMCGQIDVPKERHHLDYSVDNSFIILCKKCHKSLHNQDNLPKV